MVSQEEAARWDEHYQDGQLPWDVGVPEPHLVAAVEAGTLKPGRLLEMGCGTGTNAIWLATQGFEVTACDIAPTAIELARAKADEAGVDITFVRGSFPEPTDPFDAVFDRGVFHIPDLDRSAFARSVAERLRVGGIWISLAGSTEGPPRDHGPPRISARDIVGAVEPHLAIRSLSTFSFELNMPSRPLGWWLLAERREEPPAATTRPRARGDAG